MSATAKQGISGITEVIFNLKLKKSPAFVDGGKLNTVISHS